MRPARVGALVAVAVGATLLTVGPPPQRAPDTVLVAAGTIANPVEEAVHPPPTPTPRLEIAFRSDATDPLPPPTTTTTTTPTTTTTAPPPTTAAPVATTSPPPPPSTVPTTVAPEPTTAAPEPAKVADPEPEPTPVTPEPEVVTVPTTSEPVAQTVPEAPSASHDPPGGGWEQLRQCESGGDYTAVQRGGPGRGAYQFDQPTWDGVVSRLGRGDLVGVNPAAAWPADQDAAALQLYAERGAQPWPYCGRYV